MTSPTLSFAQNRPLDVICVGRVAVDLYAQQVGAPLADASRVGQNLRRA